MNTLPPLVHVKRGVWFLCWTTPHSFIYSADTIVRERSTAACKTFRLRLGSIIECVAVDRTQERSTMMAGFHVNQWGVGGVVGRIGTLQSGGMALTGHMMEHMLQLFKYRVNSDSNRDMHYLWLISVAFNRTSPFLGVCAPGCRG